MLSNLVNGILSKSMIRPVSIYWRKHNDQGTIHVARIHIVLGHRNIKINTLEGVAFVKKQIGLALSLIVVFY